MLAKSKKLILLYIIKYYRQIKLIPAESNEYKNLIPEEQENNQNKKDKPKKINESKNEISISKEKNKNSPKNTKINKIKSFKRNLTKNKIKCRKVNSLVQRNKPLEENKKTLKDELEKINNFRKILTKNSKIYARKYGEEILKRILSLNDKQSKAHLINNNINKTKMIGNKFINNKNNISIKKIFKKIIKKQKKINVNIINSFQIINEKDKRRRNSYEKENLNNYLTKFELLKERDNSSTNKNNTIDKKENNIKKKFIRNYSFNNIKEPEKKNYKSVLKNKEKIKYSKKNFKTTLFQEYHNISFNFIPSFINKNPNKKVETNKIVFYSILLNDLYNKYKSESSVYLKADEEKEEEKKGFLYQLYYCLGLAKIYILNFKENKLPNSFSESFSPKKNNKNPPNRLSTISENSGIRFKSFYETFSNYSQIKTSSLEKFDNKSYPNIEIVNQYYIFKDKLIGKGGSSVVYLGEDDERQKKYAIKVTDKKLKANPFKHIYDYVKEEVSILKRIHSKYIVTTYEIIESENRIYIIMEYMSSGPVLKIIENINENQIKQYTRNLICAVEHCHKIAKIIHKDINVNNLLINKEGEAKLCDFGISAVFEDDNDILPSKGPSTYTPPEKKYNEKYRGRPADIYLIGLTLYHMVFKIPLFKDFANLSKNDYINIKIPKKDNNNNDIDQNLCNLIESMLSYDPNKRPTIDKLKKDPWLTDDMKNPFPDVIKEALFYSLELARNQINSLQNKSNNNNSKDKKKNNKIEEEEETEEVEGEEEEEEEEEDEEEEK